jgi:hypothetical protein
MYYYLLDGSRDLIAFVIFVTSCETFCGSASDLFRPRPFSC